MTFLLETFMLHLCLLIQINFRFSWHITAFIRRLRDRTGVRQEIDVHVAVVDKR